MRPFQVSLQFFNTGWTDCEGPFDVEASSAAEAYTNTRTKFKKDLAGDATNYRFHVYDRGTYNRTNFDVRGQPIA